MIMEFLGWLNDDNEKAAGTNMINYPFYDLPLYIQLQIKIWFYEFQFSKNRVK